MSIKGRIVEFIFGIDLISVEQVEKILVDMDKDDNGYISVRELIKAIKG